MSGWTETRDRLLRRFSLTRENGESDSTIHCTCGVSFTWGYSGEALNEWIDMHGPHMPPLPSEPNYVELECKLEELRRLNEAQGEALIALRHIAGRDRAVTALRSILERIARDYGAEDIAYKEMARGGLGE
jgi:hypothetical protein